MKGVALDYLNNYNIFREVNLSSAFYSYLSEDRNMDSPNTQAHMMNIFQQLLDA